MAGHAGVSVNSQLTLRVDYLMRPISIVERTLLGQLVVVSNRVAIPEKIAKVRPGGLEVAIKAAQNWHLVRLERKDCHAS